MTESKEETIKTIVSPPGFFLVPDAISADDEKEILTFLENEKWTPLTIKVDTGRLVLQYGLRFNYHHHEVVADVPDIPDVLKGLINRLYKVCQEQNLKFGKATQIIVNKYTPGQGISKHIDWKGFGPVVASFTLKASADIEFENGSQRLTVHPPARSLYLMSGDARTKWTHSMPARKYDVIGGKKVMRETRVSVTIRSVVDET